MRFGDPDYAKEELRAELGALFTETDLGVAPVSYTHLQEMLSSRSGVPIKTIGNLEQLRRDINHCRVDIIYRLAQALDCDMLEILDQDKLRAQLPHRCV